MHPAPVSVLRRGLLLRAAAGALPLMSASGWAGPAVAPAWPRRAMRILVAYPPCGVSDLVARALAAQLSQALGVPVPVEHRPGASGTLALDTLARGAPDGHLLGFAAATAVGLVAARRQGAACSSSWSQTGLPVTPVAGVMRTPALLVGTAALQAATFPAMLAEARRAGGLRWATTGNGTTGHAVLQRIARATGIAFVHVPYKGGGRQITDALGGHFELLSTNVAPLQLQALRAGRLKALAVGAARRLAVLPQVPTLAELGFPQANLESLFGLFAPPHTPAALVARLHRAVAEALQTPAIREQLLTADNLPFEGSAADFARQVACAIQGGAGPEMRIRREQTTDCY